MIHQILSFYGEHLESIFYCYETVENVKISICLFCAEYNLLHIFQNDVK